MFKSKHSKVTVAEESEQSSLRDMIEEIVCAEEDESDELDLQATLNLSDRLNNVPKERKEALDILEDIFKNAPSQVILRSVKLLESIVKNCSHGFHKDLGSKQFQEAFLKLLDRKRKKKSFFKSIKQNTKNWDEIESKVLYLIQLWYDTFMMHEADFPHIMNNYKLLRKEGIKFPERSINEIHMINFKGVKSPILQVLEEKQIQVSEVTVSAKKDQHGNLAEITSQQARGFTINQDSIDSITDNILMLTAIVESAQYIEDLETQYALEMIQTLKTFIAKIELMSKEGSLRELKSSKEDVLNLCDQASAVVNSHMAKKQDIELIQQAIQASAIEEFSRAASEVVHKVGMQQDIEKEVPQEVEKQSSKPSAGINLLDLDDDEVVVSSVVVPVQAPMLQQHQPTQIVNVPTVATASNHIAQTPASQEIDLFADFIPSDVVTTKQTQAPKQSQQPTDDFDDFLDSIVK